MARDRLETARTKRARIASLIAGGRTSRDAATQAAISAQVTAGALSAINAATFGLFSGAAAADSCSITSGSAVLTSADAAWTAADVGKAIDVAGAGVAGATLRTSIAAYTSATSVTLSTVASTTVAATASSAGGLAAWGALFTLNTGSVDYTGTGTDRQTAAVFDSRAQTGAVNVLAAGAAGTGLVDDTAAIQAVIDSGARRIYLPAGTYRVTTLRFPHSAGYYSPETGIEFFGDGPWTVITRGESLAGNVVNYASEAVYEAQCALAVHSSHHRIHDISFVDCANAIYFGQYPGAVGDSHCSFNRLWNLLIKDCGTGMHWAVAQGCYYNAIENIHVTQCQIGIHLRAGSRWASATANNNRNLWKNVRTSRCYVGFWLKNGDTNDMFGVHAEGCDGVPTNNRYSLPTSILPAAITAPIGHIFDDQAHNNNAFGNVMESCDFTLYNAGNFNSFRDCLYRESETAPARVIFVTLPTHLTSRDSSYSKGFGTLSNQIAGAFAGFPAGEWVVPTQMRLKAVSRQEQGTSVTVERMMDLGAMAASAAVAATVQADSSSDPSLTTASGILECVVVGNSTASSLAHAKEFKILWQRNGSRTLTRYYLFGEVAARATGASSGDATEPFTLALSVSGKDLVVTVTAPARAFAGVSLHIRDRRNY